MTGREVVAGAWEGRSALEWQARWQVPQVHLYQRVGSTNDIARRLGEAGAPAGTVVLADEQTAGRGRHGRPWHAPAGKALLLSILLRPRIPAAEEVAPGVLPLLVGLAVARAVDEVTGATPGAAPIHAGIKWPNDVVVGGRKLAGILCEGARAGPGNAFVVVGIGVNVDQTPEDWPTDVRERATSLRLVTGRTISRAELATAIIQNVMRIAAGEAAAMSPEILVELESRDELRGRRIAVEPGPEGVASGIARDGALLLRTDAARIIPVRAGTVRVLEHEGTATRPFPLQRARNT
jgi:BirA family biotin operon repressor/biotin-[acetyl-CoA-carboxylase] ligase